MADRYLVATGNWSDPSIWSTTSGGAGGASVPVSGDIIQVDGNYNITSGLPNDNTFDLIVYLGNNSASSVTLGLSGSPTFRSLIIQSKNSAAHTVNFSDTVILNKFVAVGSSSVDKLSLMSSRSDSGVVYIRFTEGGTSYGQFLYVGENVYADIESYTIVTYPYIGSNSTSDGAGWLLQDPPKISTLVDPLTTAPGSNPNWVVTGTVTQVTSGYEGGGYKLDSTTTDSASMVTSDTYDLIGSSLIIEQSNEAASSVQFQTLSDRLLGVLWGYPFFGRVVYYKDGVSPVFNSILFSGGMALVQVSATGSVSFSESNDGVSWENRNTFQLSDTDILLARSTRIEAIANPTAPYSGAGGGNSPSTYTIGSINPKLIPPDTNFLQFF